MPLPRFWRPARACALRLLRLMGWLRPMAPAAFGPMWRAFSLHVRAARAALREAVIDHVLTAAAHDHPMPVQPSRRRVRALRPAQPGIGRLRFGQSFAKTRPGAARLRRLSMRPRTSATGDRVFAAVLGYAACVLQTPDRIARRLASLVALTRRRQAQAAQRRQEDRARRQQALDARCRRLPLAAGGFYRRAVVLAMGRRRPPPADP